MKSKFNFPKRIILSKNKQKTINGGGGLICVYNTNHGDLYSGRFEEHGCDTTYNCLGCYSPENQ